MKSAEKAQTRSALVAALSFVSLLLLLATSACSPPAPPTAHELVFPGAPVVLISIDTLRADHLPDYGYKELETPHISSLARDSILFENAYSHCPLTLPSHLSVLTGLLPQEHGVRNNVGYLFDGERHPTLATFFGGRGYATGAAVSAYVLRGTTGASSGFDFYDDGIANREGVPVGQLQRPGAATAEIGLRWIGENAARPFFFFLHLFEPHTPYDPPEPYRSRYALAYDGEIAAVDEVVGTFLSGLKDLGLYDRAVVVLISDHGEGLQDHGEQEHGIFLYREAIHVPLLLKLPDSTRGGERVKEPVQLIDVFPTLAGLAGAAPPGELRGRSLLSAASEKREIYSETLYPRIHLGLSELYSLVDGRYHFIRAPRRELFDMAADPGEKVDLVARERGVDRAMSETLEGLRGEVTPPSEVDPEVAAKLAALGYVGSVKTGGGSAALPDPKDHIGEIVKLRQAFTLSGEGRYAEAIALLRGLVAENPRFMDAWNKLALTLDAAGRYEEALDTYARAIRIEPTLAADYALAMSLLNLKLGRFDQAVAHAELALARHPAEARLLLARTEFERGHADAAEQLVREVLDDPNDRFRAAVLLGRIRTAQGRFEEALELIEATRRQVADAGAGPVESLDFVRGDLLARLNRNREAEAAFREEIAQFPSQRQPYANLALLLMVEKRPDEARELLEELGRASPSRATCLFAAKTLDYLGDRRTAETWRRRAAEFGED